MPDVYFSRSRAADEAKRRGILAFETVQLVPHADKNCWGYEERDEGPALDYATLYAETKDWIHHVEVTLKRIPVLVVTVTKDELPPEIPALFELRPLTPSLWNEGSVSFRVYKPRQAAAPRVAAQGADGASNAAREPRKPGAVAAAHALYGSLGDVPRKQAIAAAVAAGINPSTSSVQYSVWRNKNKA